MKINNRDIKERHEVKIDTRKTLLYELKDGRYMLDNKLLAGRTYTDGRKKLNWGSNLTNVKLIPEQEAKELIQKAEEERQNIIEMKKRFNKE